MKKIFLMMLAMSLLMLPGSCSSSDDDDDDGGNKSESELRVLSSGRPDWNVDLVYNESMPDWKAPNPALYENWFIMIFRIQDELKKFISDDDMVAVFVGDELRALSHPSRVMDGSQASENDSIYYILKVYGNESAEENIQLTLKLWSANLRQTFTLKGTSSFINEAVKGGRNYDLPGVSFGSSKYPVTSQVTVRFLPAQHGLEPSADDLYAAFIGDECRGTVPLTFNVLSSGQIPLIVFGSKEGETVRVLYYNAKSNNVYDTGITFLTTNQEGDFTI